MISNFFSNEITWETLLYNSHATRIGALILLSMLFMATGYWGFVKNKVERYRMLKSHALILGEDLKRKQDAVEHLHYSTQPKTPVQNRLSEDLIAFNSNHLMPDLLDDISKQGILSHVIFELLSPQPELQKDFYIEQSIKLIMKGSYSQLVNFLSHMAQMNHLMTWHDFVLEKKSDSLLQESGEEELVLKITVKIYRYNHER